ncbi:MAG: DUF885 domain-containing protein [Lachnospiraceae bacterium]|nr:DUF885 domain-containing protein [Lachnospiraceae bacterium]
MKYKPTFTKKQLLFYILCLIGIVVLFVGLLSTNSTSSRFHKANEQLFQEEMLANTLNMHYTLAYPKEYGFKDYEVILPAYNRENHVANQAALQKQLYFYQSLDSSKLSAEETYTLSLLISYLENNLQLSQYPYYEEPLAPSSGMQSQLPILLAEYTFRCKQDVEDYLKLLDQTDDYFAGLLAFEQEKAAEGLLMPAVSLDKVIEQCDTILTSNSLDSGEHFLQTTFTERLQKLLKENILTPEEATSYEHQNNRLLSTVMQPAYEALGDGLTVLKQEDIPLKGLAAKAQGRAYYEQLMIAETGSYRTMDELQQMLTAQLDREFQTLVTLLAQYEEPFFSTLQTSVETNFPYTTPAEMIAHLSQCMSTDFPSLNADGGAAPMVHIKNVSENLEEYCAPAFYLTPPLDDTESNVIYINQKNSPAGLELYTTLAHEGYPGHMYQSVYSNNLLAEQDCGTVRQLLWYGGYLEGWALYVEFLSYDYASRLMEEAGLSAQAEYIQIEKHNRSLQLCLYSLLDIMIHYENATYNQVHKTLANFGITSPESTAAIYEYIVEEPANYPKYYLGYLEILSLQDTARSLWGEAYNNYAFHEFFLQYGPADFHTLNDCLKTYPLQ